MQANQRIHKQLWEQVYARPRESAPDVDEDLYGGFIGNQDRRLLTSARHMSGKDLAQLAANFQDARLEELLFRYRARNFYDSLNEDEQAEWENHRIARLIHGEHNARNVEGYFNQIDQLSENASEEDEVILGALYDYAEMIVPIQD